MNRFIEKQSDKIWCKNKLHLINNANNMIVQSKENGIFLHTKEKEMIDNVQQMDHSCE